MQKAVREAVAESAAAVADYRAGSERALNFVVGLVMKKTHDKADAGEVHRPCTHQERIKIEVNKPSTGFVASVKVPSAAYG